MKKIIFIVIICLILFSCMFTYSQSYVIAWDPVEMTGTITYEVFLKELGQSQQLLGETYGTEYTIILMDEGTYVVGVRTVRYINMENYYSVINWSDENGEWTPIPFVLEYYTTVQAPKNLRLQ